MESQSIKEYLGNYDDYISKKKELLSLSNLMDERAKAASAPTRTALKDERRRERMEKEQEKEHKEKLSKLEVQIHYIEDEMLHLETQMADPNLYENIDEMLKVQEKYTQLKEELEELYSEWMELA